MNTKGKILIIDDNEDVLFALNLLLEPYVEKIKVTTQPTRIVHFMPRRNSDVVHSEAYALSHRCFAMQ